MSEAGEGDRPEGSERPEGAEAAEGEAGEAPPGEAAEELSQEDREAYERMMATLSQMNGKIEKARNRLQADKMTEKKEKTDEISDRLISSKESSEIITKENLLTDITQTYEKAVVEVYSDNSKLKKRVDEMGKTIREQNTKLLAHAQREKELVAENERLRAELNKAKDEKLIAMRGNPGGISGGVESRVAREREEQRERKTQGNSKEQQDDFDFWSMPQDNYGKKKKEVAQDSNLWVNEKGNEGGLFLTEEKTRKGRR